MGAGVTPAQVADVILVGGLAGLEDSPLDYEDDMQIAKSLVVSGERWVLVLRRVPM